MNNKSPITLMVLFGMTMTLTARTPYWNIDNLPIPSEIPGSGGSGFTLTGPAVGSEAAPSGVLATNGTVYALGSDGGFQYLVSWTACSGWSAIATFALPPTVALPGPRALCLGSNGNLYVGGEFISVTEWPEGPTVNVTNIAVYNLNSGSWAGLGNPFLQFNTNPVTAIAVDTNQKVYIATLPVFREGILSLTSTNIFMVYSNSQWVSVGGGMEVYEGYTQGFPVNAMVANGSNIYIAGDLFGGYDGPNHTNVFVTSTNIIKWNGASNAWQAMGAGSDIWGTNCGTSAYDSHIYALAVAGSNVFIAGGWSSGMGEDSEMGPGYDVGIFSTNGTWLGMSGSPALYNDGCGYQNGLALTVQNGNVYLGGDFEYTGACSGTAANGIAVWTNSEWQPFATGGVLTYDGIYLTGTVNLLAADANAVYVFGTFSKAGGLPTTDAARYVTKTVSSQTLDPCQTEWPLVDINFEWSANPPTPMVGQAAFGFSSSDYWNPFEETVKCNIQPYTNINNLTNVFGFETGVGISFAEGNRGAGTTSGSAVVLLTNFCHSNCGSNAATIIINNLPFIQSSGVSGAYDVYVYGYGGITTIAGTEYSENAQFTISPSGTNVYGSPVTTLATSSGIYDINTWYEGNQYVVFPNVPISSGTKLEITVAPDPSSPVGEWSINGIQIVPYPYYP